MNHDLLLVQALLGIINFIVLLFQFVLRTEIKRLDEKINLFSNRLFVLEKYVWTLRNGDTEGH
jgi:hypothetical protein